MTTYDSRLEDVRGLSGDRGESDPIMFMVSSLNFFLAEVAYRGDFEGQVY